MAEMAQFHPWIQEPMEAGLLTMQQAWALEWELMVDPSPAWSDPVLPLARVARLYHLDVTQSVPQ